MALDTNLATEVQKLAPSAIIDLFELSVYPEITDKSIYSEPTRFHSGVSGIEDNIFWQGNEYTRFPVEFSGFESNTKGTIPRPIVKVANIGGAISSLLYDFDNLIGAKVTRKRTLYKYLDTVNFPGGVNLEANPDVGFNDEVYYVSRKVVENGIFVELELSPSWDLHGIKLPRRLCTQNICMWKYQGLECGYFDLPVVVRLNQNFTSDATTGITVTSTAHKLKPGDGIYLRFNSGLVDYSSVYNIKIFTPNTFTVLAPALTGTNSGTVDITNRFTYTDVPIFDSTQVENLDRCGKRLNSCKSRYGGGAQLPYGAYPGVGWIR